MKVLCKQAPLTKPSEEVRTSAEDEKIIVCGYCNYHITDPSKKIAVNDSFQHVFANPHGYIFEIGCFSEAKGCRTASTASNEFSWFIGYSWQIGICCSCGGHLGWAFTSDYKQFYGLILEKLIFP